jgi:hypothetical protein
LATGYDGECESERSATRDRKVLTACHIHYVHLVPLIVRNGGDLTDLRCQVSWHCPHRRLPVQQCSEGTTKLNVRNTYHHMSLKSHHTSRTVPIWPLGVVCFEMDPARPVRRPPGQSISTQSGRLGCQMRSPRSVGGNGRNRLASGGLGRCGERWVAVRYTARCPR